jgi:hypothetical protein
MGSAAVLISAPSWESVSSLFDDNRHAVLLTVPPAAGPWPLQPADGVAAGARAATAPVGVSDWLVRDALDAGMLRRCLRHVRERGVLENTLQRLAEQDPLTGIANRQGFQTLLRRAWRKTKAAAWPWGTWTSTTSATPTTPSATRPATG